MDDTLVAGIIGAVAGVAGGGLIAWATLRSAKTQISAATVDVEKQIQRASDDVDRRIQSASDDVQRRIQSASDDVDRELRQARESLDRELEQARELRDLADIRVALQPLVTRVKTEGRFYIYELVEERKSGSERWPALARELILKIALYRQALLQEASALLVTVGPDSPVWAAVNALDERASEVATGLEDWEAGRVDTDEVERLIAAYDRADGDFVIAAYHEAGRQRPDKAKTGTNTGTSKAEGPRNPH